MQKVLVTGASGFIGSRIANYFKEQGFNVLGWDVNEATGKCSVIRIDMANGSMVIDSLEDFRPDIIIHCAGQADVSKSVKAPEIDFYSNVIVTHTLLFAMHKLEMNNTRFVFLSSAGVYGNPKTLPIFEEMPVNPLSPYALHKVICEEICKYFVNNYQMDIKIARIFSAYGAGLKKQIFWDMFMKSLNGSLPLFGTGNESRDYIHINDVVKAIFLIATSSSDYLFFNVANGEELSIKTVAETFVKCIGLNNNIISFNNINREGDPLNWRADISKLNSLGYSKSVNIESGLLDYVNWCKEINS